MWSGKLGMQAGVCCLCLGWGAVSSMSTRCPGALQVAVGDVSANATSACTGKPAHTHRHTHTGQNRQRSIKRNGVRRQRWHTSRRQGLAVAPQLDFMVWMAQVKCNGSQTLARPTGAKCAPVSLRRILPADEFHWPPCVFDTPKARSSACAPCTLLQSVVSY